MFFGSRDILPQSSCPAGVKELFWLNESIHVGPMPNGRVAQLGEHRPYNFKINLFNILHAKCRKTKSLDRVGARLYTPILLLERRNPS